MNRLILVFFTLLNFSSAHAATIDYKQTLLNALTSLKKDLYVTDIGDYSIDTFAQTVQSKLDFETVTSGFQPAEPNRDCAYYLTGDFKIFLNQDCIQNLSPWILQSLLIHEALGALGYDDDAYEWSSIESFSLFLHQQDPGFFQYGAINPLNYVLPGQKPILTIKGGSITTSGGGDPWAIRAKTCLYYAIINGAYLMDDTAFDKVRKIPIMTLDMNTDYSISPAGVLSINRAMIQKMEADGGAGKNTPSLDLYFPILNAIQKFHN